MNLHFFPTLSRDFLHLESDAELWVLKAERKAERIPVASKESAAWAHVIVATKAIHHWAATPQQMRSGEASCPHCPVGGYDGEIWALGEISARANGWTPPNFSDILALPCRTEPPTESELEAADWLASAHDLASALPPD